MATDTENSNPITTATTTAAAAATTEEKRRMLVLKSNDSETFEVEEEVAKMSETIKQMLEDEMDVSSVPIPNVNGATLAKVIEYCKHQAAVAAADGGYKGKGEGTAKAKADDDAKAWENEFIKMDDDPLFSVLLAANYLNIKTLLDLCCQTIADKIKDFSVEEVRKIFGIKNDFTPEEEETIRNENAWAFE